MYFSHGANGSVADQFDDPPHAAERVALIAHLRGDVHLVGHFAHSSGFVDRMCERLLTVNMFAQLHRHHAGRRVMMVGRGDCDRVDVLPLFQHLAVIGVPRGLRKLFEHLGRALSVDVAERDDVFARAAVDISPTFTRRADRGDVELLIRRSARSGGLARDPDSRTQSGGLFHEFASR